MSVEMIQEQMNQNSIFRFTILTVESTIQKKI